MSKMHLRALTLTLLLAGGAAYPLAGQAPSREAVSITHVTVVDVATGKKLPDQTVVVQGERILSVAAFDSANPLEGRVVDAHGNFLIPGLSDMHVQVFRTSRTCRSTS